jgi:2-amino-4-hydroxy-6-hydroxymethyldihydropteridine diphosphokinase
VGECPADATPSGEAPARLREGCEVYLGLGSNLGRPKENLLAGLAALEKGGFFTRLALSSCYETAPVGKTDQPPFVNAVAHGIYRGTARELLAELLAVETALGRERRERWGPRTLDLDLLLFGREIIAEPGLEVPHPRLHTRAFVLVPLMELAPGLLLPGLEKTAGELLASMTPAERAAQKVERTPWA